MNDLSYLAHGTPPFGVQRGYAAYHGAGVYLGKWGKEGNGDGEFANPAGIAIDDSGMIYVVDAGNHRVEVFRIQELEP